MQNLAQILPMLAAFAGQKAPGAVPPPAPAPIIPARPAAPVALPQPMAMPDGPSIADMRVPDFASSLPGVTPDMEGALAAPPRREGFFDRIGNFLRSDEGRATMMRFAAGAAKDGLAGGLGAATEFADTRRARAEEREDKGLDRMIRSRAIDNDYELGTDQNNISREGQANQRDIAEMEEGGRNRRYGAPSGSDILRSRVDMATHANPSGNAQLSYRLGLRGQDLDRYQHDTPSGNVRMNESGANYRHNTPSGDARLGIGSKAPHGKRVTQYVIPAEKEWTGFGIGDGRVRRDTTKPERMVRDEEIIPVSEIQPGGDMPRPQSEAEYNALPPGTKFIAPNGTIRTKP